MDKSTVGGEQEMGTEWVKVERIGLEEDSHEKEKKIKFDSRTRQNVAFTKLGLVTAQATPQSQQFRLLSHSSSGGNQQPDFTLLQLPPLGHGDWDSSSRQDY